MPHNSKIRDATTVIEARSAIEGQHVWTPDTSESLEDLVPNLIRVISYNGKLFTRDDADTTTAHDGVACIVTQGGVRFKATDFGAGSLIRIFNVKSIISTPPASPANGDVHIVDVGATGVWAAKDGKVAHRTSAGWIYITPKLYDQAHVASVLQIYHFNASSLWVPGIPALTLGSEQVHFSNLRHGLGQQIENQTTNTPPGSPSDGAAYIIGPSPTGAWSGHALKFVEWRNSAWEIYTPKVGWKVYNKQTDRDVVYTSGGWQSSQSGYINIVDSGAPTGSLRVFGNSFSFSGSLSYNSTYEVIAMNYTPKRVGAVVDVEFISKLVKGDPAPGAPVNTVVGLFIDSQATTTNWVAGPEMQSVNSKSSLAASFIWIAPDTNAHVLRIVSRASNANFSHTLEGNRLIVRERS
jgi:hypothetical protein